MEDIQRCLDYSQDVYVSHPLAVDKIAGGGVFVHFENLSEKSVEIIVKADVVNESKSNLVTLNVN